MTTEQIEDHLIDLERRLNALPEAEESPPTTLQVLGRNRRERYWQRLLVHFLRPDESHGLGEDVLEHVLNGLSLHPALDFSFTRLDLAEIQIEQEVSASQGRPDLLVWSKNDWFLCIEIKVDSSEGDDQTVRYVESESFHEIDLDKAEVPDEGRQYLYLTPRDTPGPEAEEFTPIAWEWLASELQTFLADSYGKYPSRTTAQLTDFVDTVRSELTMTDYQENRREKVELAIDHYEPIEAVLDALEDYVEELHSRWPEWFLEQAPSGWGDSWLAPETSTTYLKAYRTDWLLNSGEERATSSDADLHVYWEFRLTDRHLGRGVLDHRLVVAGADDELRRQFRDAFYSASSHDEVTRLVSKLDSEADKDVSAPEWENHTYQYLVDGDYRFDDAEGFERSVGAAFEDLQPAFRLATEAIPERSSH